MIRELAINDIDIICKIVNDNWKRVYAGYVNTKLLSDTGCIARKESMKKDFKSGRLFNYVYEYNKKIAGLLSVGDTSDKDKKGAFEIWRIYLAKEYQNKGIGSELLTFAEKQALKYGKKEVVIWAFKENRNAVSFYKKHGYIVDKVQYLGYPYSAYGVRFNKKIVI